MSNLIRKNYKLILSIIAGLLFITFFPIIVEIILNLGVMIGSNIRYGSSLCV